MTWTRGARRLLKIVAALAVLVLVAAVALPFLVDANRFGPLIADRAQSATGRTLGFGSISFRLLPVPGLSVRGPIKFSDSAAYPGRSALTAQSLTVRLGLLGLLRGRVSVGAIIIERPTLTLIRDARGGWNFDDLVRRAAAAPAEGPGARETGASTVSVERARITKGRVQIYDDAIVPGRREELVIAPIDATIKGWGGEGPAQLDMTVALGKSALTLLARLHTEGGRPLVIMQARGTSVHVEDLATLLPWLSVARPAGLQVKGSVDIDGSAEVPLEHPEGLRFKGTLALGGVSYRDAGMALPVKNLAGTIVVDGDRAEWRDFTVAIGSSSLHGSLRVENFLKPRIGFTLNSPRLDLNELVATLVPVSGAAGSATPASPRTGPGGSGLLDQVSGSGRLDIKQVRFQTFDLSNVRAAVGLAHSVFSLSDLGASFYGGTLGGSASVDVGRVAPGYAASVRLAKVDVDPLLTAYGDNLKDLVRGRLSGQLALSATGSSMTEILGTAHGTGALEITDGAVTSFSVLKQVAALLEMAGGKGIGRDSTTFQSLRADLVVADRKARTENLTLLSQDLELEGKGWVGLDATLNLDVTARFSEESTSGMVAKNARLGGLTDKGRLVVYFTLQGDLASPSFRMNTSDQAKAAEAKAKEKLRSRLKDRLLKQFGQQQEEQPN